MSKQYKDRSAVYWQMKIMLENSELKQCEIFVYLGVALKICRVIKI